MEKKSVRGTGREEQEKENEKRSRTKRRRKKKRKREGKKGKNKHLLLTPLILGVQWQHPLQIVPVICFLIIQTTKSFLSRI